MRGEFTVADSFLLFLGPMRSFRCFLRLTTTWCLTRELKVAGGWGKRKVWGSFRLEGIFLWRASVFCRDFGRFLEEGVSCSSCTYNARRN